jgi:L-iditol 2-dehydrogenase
VIQNRELWITRVFRYTDMITGRFGLDDVEQALNADQNPSSLKTMVVPA